MPQSVLDFSPRQSERIHMDRKESSFRRQLSLVDLDGGREAATVRFYGNGSRAYCCAWFNGLHHYGYTGGAMSARGSGWAGGYGYHRDSAALSVALKDAGFTLAEPFDGTGETGETAALHAIAEHLGIKRALIVSAHP